jgi:quinolinate synthase
MWKECDNMLKEEILKLKKEKNAVILAHFYQHDDVQDIADFVGDSLALSRKAANTKADVIVFCGVYFMAETAKILSPEKMVLLPKKNALCNMASMITYDALKKYKEENPERMIVTYVNTRAEIKALSDIIVTSSNAEKIIKNFEGRKIMYTPDKNLGLYLKDKLGYDIEVWPGYCYIHDKLTINDIKKLRKEHPEAEVLIHPEAPLEVLKLADFVGSTKQILDYATASKSKEFVVGTDKGIIHSMKKNNPDKEFYLLSHGLSCFNMKRINLEDVRDALKYDQHQIEVDPEISKKAKEALDEMLRLS